MKKFFSINIAKDTLLLEALDDMEGDRFGGLGFVFQEGSPFATDASQAILNISENGRLKQLEINWFAPSSDCLNSRSLVKTESLTWHNFCLFGVFIYFQLALPAFVIWYSHQLYEHYHEAYNYLRTKIVHFKLLLYDSIKNPMVKTCIPCKSQAELVNAAEAKKLCSSNFCVYIYLHEPV